MAKKRDDSGMQSKLMNAAMTAFSRKGLNDCRMSDIADAAGLARGTAYLYFRSKEQLMLSMYKLYSSRIIESQKAMLAKAGDLTDRGELETPCVNGKSRAETVEYHRPDTRYADLRSKWLASAGCKLAL